MRHHPDQNKTREPHKHRRALLLFRFCPLLPERLALLRRVRLRERQVVPLRIIRRQVRQLELHGPQPILAVDRFAPLERLYRLEPEEQLASPRRVLRERGTFDGGVYFFRVRRPSHGLKCHTEVEVYFAAALRSGAGEFGDGFEHADGLVCGRRFLKLLELKQRAVNILAMGLLFLKVDTEAFPVLCQELLDFLVFLPLFLGDLSFYSAHGNIFPSSVCLRYVVWPLENTPCGHFGVILRGLCSIFRGICI
mmetsp:Transcript_8043/g.20114  ORF Transcript_8043/g.20114 Transcript_8043/m.20114 type:complete len:251 (+) Transcript_8043:896-1648(+)